MNTLAGKERWGQGKQWIHKIFPHFVSFSVKVSIDNPVLKKES